MHIIKLHSSDCKDVLKEATRDHKSKVGKIDESRTHLNYSLAPEENRVTDANLLKERIKTLGVTRKIRDDAVLSCSCIITLPTDYTGDTEAFMRSAYKALTEILCKGHEDRVIQAEVHMDEKTPHMHFAFYPIVEKVNKKGKPTIALDAKTFMSTPFLCKFHPLTEKLISEDLKTPVKLYDEEKCKERAKKHAKGDFSADYESIEEFKARKTKEEAKKKLEDKLEDITLTIGGKELELCEIDGLLEEKDKELDKKDKELAEKDKIIAEKTAEIEKGNDILEKLIKRFTDTKKLYDNLIETIENKLPAFYEAYKRINKCLDHYFKYEQTTYLAVKEKADKPMNKGLKAKESYDELISEKKPITADYLASKYKKFEQIGRDIETATNELNSIVDVYEDDDLEI